MTTSADTQRALELLGRRLVTAVAEHLHRNADDSILVGSLLKYYHPSQSEVERAANACDLPPTLTHLRARLTSDPHEGLSEEDFDAIVAAARREAP